MIYPIKFVINISTILLLLLQSGCASFGIGESEFACPGRPAGVRCMSASEVYAATADSDQVAATADKALGDDPDIEDLKSGASTENSNPQTAKHNHPHNILNPLIPAFDKPVPVRTPAKIMRIWIASWEDINDVLHIGGYHFKEIEARRWVIGEPEQTEPVRLFSIQHKQESKGDGGKDQGDRGVRLDKTMKKVSPQHRN